MGVDSDNVLYVWSLPSGHLILSRKEHSDCLVHMLLTVSVRSQDFLLVYFNILEPLNRVQVFEVTMATSRSKNYLLILDNHRKIPEKSV